jgi:hemerythrin-like metal-binding protein
MLPRKIPESWIIGHIEIDSEHQELLDILHDCQDNQTRKKEDPCGCWALFFIALRKHFRREEVVMAEFGYPGLAHHCFHHNAVLRDYRKLEHLPQSVFLEEALDTIINDIVTHDLSFQSYLSNNSI